MDDKLLTPSQLAQKLAVPVSWVYGKTRQKGPGSIPVYRAGKYCRFRLDEVMGWLKRRNENE